MGIAHAVGNCGGCFPARSLVEKRRSSSARSSSLSLPDVWRSGTPDHALTIVGYNRCIKDHYEVDRTQLGAGAFGSVRKALHQDTQQVRAIKTIAKARVKKCCLTMEAQMMKHLDHPHIVKLHETFEDERNLYLCMELCDGGELMDKIMESGHFAEMQAAGLLKQIFEAVCYLHGQGVCHRDLKPENCLLSSKGPIENACLKIIDFGFSRQFAPNQVFRTMVGTHSYAAPQVMNGSYNHLCDLWSVGVMMYMMLSGQPPFFGFTSADVVARVRSGRYTFQYKHWQHISEHAKDLVCCLLAYAPLDRCCAEQALDHAWIQLYAPSAMAMAL